MPKFFDLTYIKKAFYMGRLLIIHQLSIMTFILHIDATTSFFISIMHPNCPEAAVLIFLIAFCSPIFPLIAQLTNDIFYIREAIALAKVRLSPIDPVLEDLYTLWAHQLTKDGNFEQAAKWLVWFQGIQSILSSHEIFTIQL